MKKFLLIGISIIVFSFNLSDDNSGYQFALLKYSAGDWYSNPTALNNLASYCNDKMNMNLSTDYATVEVGSAELFSYPFVHMTGHGNVVFSDEDALNLRAYLEAGGFLHIDDNYGMDPFVRLAMRKVFPELSFIELPYEHPIYHQDYSFKNGLPKVHEHDGFPPMGFGLIYEGRLVCFYTYECDLGDGWEDPEVHKDLPEVREQALRMGANIVKYAFSF